MDQIFKVIGTWGSQKYTVHLGTFTELEEAMDRAKNWETTSWAGNMHMDLIEVIKITESVVLFDEHHR